MADKDGSPSSQEEPKKPGPSSKTSKPKFSNTKDMAAEVDSLKRTTRELRKGNEDLKEQVARVAGRWQRI